MDKFVTNNPIYIFTTYYGNDNYGGLLQAFALQQYLIKKGYNAVDVCYKTEYNDVSTKKYSAFEKIKMNYVGATLEEKISISFSLIKRIFLKTLFGKKIQDRIEIRKKYFAEFREKHIIHTNRVYSDANLNELPNNAYAYITGSDLVWLIGNKTELPAGYWLTPFSGKKISYAASIPMKNLSDIQVNKISIALKDYTAISVREYAGKDLLEKNINTSETIFQVVDPVFLLTKTEWIDLLSLNSINTDEYICTYFLGESQKNRRFAKYISHKFNKRIVNVAHVLRFCNSDIMFGTSRVDISVPEFVNIIKNASIVITDSFHGAAFSEIFEVPYLVTERFEGSRKNSLNERLFTLLKNTGKDEMYFNGSLKEMKEKFDGLSDTAVHKQPSTLQENIENSKKFLDNSLEN